VILLQWTSSGIIIGGIIDASKSVFFN